MNEYADKTCDSCAHWHRMQPPPGTSLVTPGGMGHCREQLHVIVILRPNAQEAMPVHVPVPAEFPACSRYQKRSVEVRT